MNERIKIGVNYVPSNNWYYMWQQPNFDSVARDFDAIKAVGFDHIRLHILWSVFQPNATFVYENYIENVRKLIQIAESRELKVCLTIFNGWLSGFWFLPPYTTYKHIFKDKEILDGQRFFLESLSCLASLENLDSIDIANEINVYGDAVSHFSISEGDAWLKEISLYAKKCFKDQRIVFGADHVPWFRNKFFSKRALAEYTDGLALHTWIKFTGALDYGIGSAECYGLAKFCAELANAYNDKSKPVWIQEFGISELWAEQKDISSFISKTMELLFTVENLDAITWWCSHDIDKRLLGFEPLEYGLGIFDINNKPKPIFECFRDYALNHRRIIVPKKTALVIDKDEELKENFGRYYLERFSRLLESGLMPVMIRKEKLTDSEYIISRNIDKIVY